MNSSIDQNSKAKAGRSFLLFPARTTLGWRVIKRVTLQQGENMIGLGEWRRVIDSISREHIGYQVCAPEMSRGDYELPSMQSPASITMRESEINAFSNFDGGRSRTARLSEEQRDARRVKEDRIERVQKKVLVWPYVGAAKGDILRVWPQ